jgi:hypothetical protein
MSSVLVNHFESPNVGHAIEALRYCLGHQQADPSNRVSVLLNEATPTELAGCCPFIEQTYVVGPLGADPAAALARVPREWDWVLDNPRRAVPEHVAGVPDFGRFYAATDRHFRARLGHGVIGQTPPGYRRHTQLRLELPPAWRIRANRLLDGATTRIALLPAGSGERWLYPSIASWELVLAAMARQHPDAVVCLIGRLRRDGRTSTSLTVEELRRLRDACPRTLDCFDLDLLDQLAVVEACDLFVSPHSGFGMAAVAVGTPWLTLSGGRWPEYFFNRVPFYSVLPDTGRFPCFTTFGPAPVLDDDEDGEGCRAPSMCRQRIVDDLEELLDAARLLLRGEYDYQRALREHFERLLRCLGGDRSRLWSIDEAHLDVLVDLDIIPAQRRRTGIEPA